ncbi:MYLK2 kinase, partial [Baryphthengus martii]|nr:MYLK2 kinase [Baryphthengus martii]
MEQGGGMGSVPGAGGAGGTVPPKAEGSTTQPVPVAPEAAQPCREMAAPVEGMVPEDVPKDAGKDKPGKEEAPAASATLDGAQAQPRQEEAVGEAGRGKTEPAREMVPTAPEPQDGGEAEKAALAAQHDEGRAASPEGKVPAATEAQGGGKEEAPAAGESKGGKAAPMKVEALAAAKAQDGGKGVSKKEKAPAVGKPKGGQAATVEGKGQGGEKDEPRKEQGPGGLKAEGGGKAESVEVKAPAAVGTEGGKVKLTEETALAAASAQDGGKEEPAKEETTAAAKEKVPAAAKAQDGEKAAAKAEKPPADKKPTKEKAPVAARPQDGKNKAAKAEEAPPAKKAQEGGKKESAKQKAADAAKAQGGENKGKAPAAAKAADGGKKAAQVEPPPAAAEAGEGGEEPREAAATAGAKAWCAGEKAAKEEEPPRPPLLQSLSCPATCQREEQPRVEVMEMIPEDTAVVEPREGPAEPGPAPVPPALGTLQPVEVPSTPQERTLPSTMGQPSPGGPPSSMTVEPPPSPYLTPDFGKEDPSEILDDVPPPPAPFAHRIVTLRSTSVSSQFNLDSKDILGGGKFGEVHTCTEKQTGLKLAAKVIRKQGAKDKEMVLLEIDVMNQLNHRNLIQLYDAIETPREIILFMEFVEGGELFERIIDDDYHLTEVDCMVFVRQICEGIRFMHHMRVLHLDLKPENILCVAATGHMVKIIDFGLARRYNPQEKLKVNFGTPEFLSPEVVNYEQVSYSTDMWSMGVITYMLLSGLSPFLGDNDTETLNNVLAANWYFDEETFESVSDEAKDFVSNLIIKEKSARMSAAQCLEHPWLNNLAEKAKLCNRRLKSQVLLKKYVMRRRWKKNFIGVCAANRFKKITSSGSLTALGV